MLYQLSQRNHVVAHERLVEAINYLIEAPQYVALSGELRRIIETWDTHPMVYGGRLSILNAVVDVGLNSAEAFDKLMRLVERKRALRPAVKRTTYQRDLMRDRRSRMRKAIMLHELQYGPLRGEARTSKMKSIQDRWAKSRHEFLADKGVISWKDRNAAAQEFWDGIDRRLDINLQEARHERPRASA